MHQVDKDRRALRDSPTDAAERGNVDTDRVAFALNHQINRLSLQLRGSITDLEFAPVTSTSGAIISNAERNTTQREVAVRTSWAVNGRMDVFAEVAVNDRDYRAAPDDGILRSSTGERYRLGVTFGPQNNTLRGEVSAGWGWQTPRDGRLAEIEGFIVDANLAWRASALTTFSLTARSDFLDTTTTGSFGALSRQVGLEARHTIRRYLIGIAGIKYTVNPYEAVSINERELATEAGFDYYLNRDAIIFARYQHIDFHSTVAGSTYSDDVVHVGSARAPVGRSDPAASRLQPTRTASTSTIGPPPRGKPRFSRCRLSRAMFLRLARNSTSKASPTTGTAPTRVSSAVLAIMRPITQREAPSWRASQIR